MKHGSSANNALKSALSGGGQAFGEAKAHSLTKPSLARLRNVLSARRYLKGYVRSNLVPLLKN